VLPRRGYLLTSLHGGMTGRLLRYDPASRRTAVLLEGIFVDTA